MSDKHYISDETLWGIEADKHNLIGNGIDVLSEIDVLLQNAYGKLETDKYGLMQTASYHSIETRIKKQRKKNDAQYDYARKIHEHLGDKEYRFYDKINEVLEELSILDIKEYKVDNTLGVQETVTISNGSYTGTPMYDPDGKVIETTITRDKASINIEDIQSKTNIMKLKEQFAAYLKREEEASGKVFSTKEKRELQKSFNESKLSTRFDHDRLSEGWKDIASTTLNFVPVIGGVKQILEGCTGYTMSGEKLTASEKQSSIIFGALSATIDVVTLGAMSAGKTAAQIGITVGVEVGTRVALGWTSEFAIEKLREMGLSSGEIFLVNIIGNIIANKAVNTFTNKFTNTNASGLGHMNAEDAAKYSKFSDEVINGTHLPPGMDIDDHARYMLGLEKLDDISAIKKVDYDRILELRKNAILSKGSGSVGSAGDVVKNVDNAKPNQVHHYATDKNAKYTKEFEKITDKYDLDLNSDWNKDLLPHQGRHPNAYHEFVLEEMRIADDIGKGNTELFLEIFNENVKIPVINNPNMLYKDYWNKLPK